LLEAKQKIKTLEMMLLEREEEREILLINKTGDSSHHRIWLEKQSAKMIALQEQVDEYKRRDEVCERKWTSLIQDCDQARAEANHLRAQLNKQR